jgi:hypothetical protein
VKKPLSDFPLKWKESHNVYSNDIEGEIWLMFENLAGTQYLDSVIRNRINNSQLQNLTKSVIQSTKRLLPIVALTDNDVPEILDEVRNVILQARDIYFAARALPLLSKPILLFYAFEKLAEALYLMTWKKTEYGHGLWYDKLTHTITICRSGFFANFHDCISDDPFYQNKPSIRFENVIECGPLYQIELDSGAYRSITYPINTIDNNHILLTEAG